MLGKRHYWKQKIKEKSVSKDDLIEFQKDLEIYLKKVPNWNDRQSM